MRPTASLSKNGMIAAIAILALAVVACVIVGFKFSGISDATDDKPETEALQQIEPTTSGGELPLSTTKPSSTTEPSTTTPVSTTKPTTTKSSNSITEFVSKPEKTSSIFDVQEPVPTTRKPTPTTRPNTTKPTTTISDEEPEMPEEEEPTTTKIPGVSFVVGEMG